MPRKAQPGVKKTRNITDEERQRRKDNMAKVRAAKAGAKPVELTAEDLIAEAEKPINVPVKREEPKERLGKKVLIDGKPFRQIHVPVVIERDDQSEFREQLGSDFEEDMRYVKIEEPHPTWGLPSTRAKYLTLGYRDAKELSPMHWIMKIPVEIWEKRQMEVYEKDAERRKGSNTQGGESSQESFNQKTVTLEEFFSHPE